MKRALIIGGIICVILVGLATGGLYLLRPGFVPGLLQDVVAQKTGRTLTLAGVPRLSLWPHVAVTLQGVEFSMPADMEPGVFARAKELRVGVDLRALIARELKVTELTLVGPRINLLIDRQGRASWSFEPAGKAEPEGEINGGGAGPITDYSIAPINIENGVLVFLDERAGRAFEVHNVNARLKANDRLDGGEISGDAIWREQKVRFSGAIKSLARLSQGGSPGGLSIETANFKFQFDGRIATGKSPGIAGEVAISTPDMRAVAHWLGQSLPEGQGLKNISITGGVDASATKLALKAARLRFDGMTADGDLAMLFAATGPQIAAQLKFDKLDLNTYLPEPQAGTETEDTGSVEGWSAAPLSFAPLKGFAGKVNLAADSLIYRKTVTGPAALEATLRNGLLDATITKLKLYDGEASARVVVDGSGKTPALKFAFNGAGFDGRALLKDFANFGRIEGRTSVKISIATSGNSQQEMVSLLKGAAQLEFTDGALRGINIAQMVRNLSTGTLSGWQEQPEQKTDFSELGATFAIADGLAETHDLKLASPGLRITGGGEADILRRALDFKVEPKIVASLEGQGGEQEMTGLPVPVIVRGPWSKPKIYPDIVGILNDPEAAYATLKKLGNSAEVIAPQALDALESQAEDAIGEENTKKLKKKGKKLFKNLFGN